MDKEKFSWDEEAGAGYLVIGEKEIDETIPVDDVGIVLDFSDGELVGIEFLNQKSVPSQLLD